MIQSEPLDQDPTHQIQSGINKTLIINPSRPEKRRSSSPAISGESKPKLNQILQTKRAKWSANYQDHESTTQIHLSCIIWTNRIKQVLDPNFQIKHTSRIRIHFQNKIHQHHQWSSQIITQVIISSSGSMKFGGYLNLLSSESTKKKLLHVQIHLEITLFAK